MRTNQLYVYNLLNKMRLSKQMCVCYPYIAGEVEIHTDASVILNKTGPVTMMVIEKQC